jgi:hypothetical protein
MSSFRPALTCGSIVREHQLQGTYIVSNVPDADSEMRIASAPSAQHSFMFNNDRPALPRLGGQPNDFI